MKLIGAAVLLAILVMLAYPYIAGTKMPPYEETSINISYREPLKGEDIGLKTNATGKVILDQSHSNLVVIGDNSTHTYFASLFSKAGYSLDAPGSKDRFRDSLLLMRSPDILVISAPLESYNESGLIANIVNNGGKLILIGDGRLSEKNINEISVPLGIIFNGDMVYDIHESYKNYKNPLVYNFAGHNITQGLRNFVIYDGSSISGGNPIAFAGSNAESSKGLKELPVLSVIKFGKGYVVAVGDSDLWSNEHIFDLDNRNLLVNIINWLQEV